MSTHGDSPHSLYAHTCLNSSRQISPYVELYTQSPRPSHTQTHAHLPELTVLNETFPSIQTYVHTDVLPHRTHTRGPELHKHTHVHTLSTRTLPHTKFLSKHTCTHIVPTWTLTPISTAPSRHLCKDRRRKQSISLGQLHLPDIKTKRRRSLEDRRHDRLDTQCLSLDTVLRQET